MNRIVLNRGTNIEPCLLETKTQSARPSEQIDSDRMPHHVIETYMGQRLGATLNIAILWKTGIFSD